MTMKVYASMEAGHVPVLAGQVQPMNSGTLTITLGPDMYLGSGVPNLFRDLAHLYLSGGNRAFGAPSETAILEYDRWVYLIGLGSPDLGPSALLDAFYSGFSSDSSFSCVSCAGSPAKRQGRVGVCPCLSRRPSCLELVREWWMFLVHLTQGTTMAVWLCSLRLGSLPRCRRG